MSAAAFEDLFLGLARTARPGYIGRCSNCGMVRFPFFWRSFSISFQIWKLLQMFLMASESSLDVTVVTTHVNSQKEKVRRYTSV